MGQRFVIPFSQWITGLGVPGDGFRLYFYEWDTATPLATYTDSALTIPHENPVIASAVSISGTYWPEIFLQDEEYKVVLTTAGGAVVWTSPTPITGGFDAGDTSFLQSGTGAVSVTLREELLYGKPVNALEFMSAAQRADVLGYLGTLDVTAVVQAALNAAWTSNRDCFVPSGLYSVTGLIAPGTAAGRTKAFRMYGQGTGEVFARGLTGGTIFKSVTNAPVLQCTPDVPDTGQGNIEVDHIRFEGDSTTPVVHLRSFYAQSSFHHNAIWQAGTGGGFKSELSNTIEIHNNYAVNDDYATFGLGAARTGIGFEIIQTIPTGLTMLRKNTSRGFKYGYKIGDGTANRLYSPKLEHNECSLNYTGVWLTSSAQKAVVDAAYCEGGDGGDGVVDQGNYNTVTDSLIFEGYGFGIRSEAETYGSVYTGNVLSAGSIANTILLRILSSGANGGPGKKATGNTFVFSGSGGAVAGVIGINILGVDPRLDLSGNVFDPRGPWTGGAGTAKFSDQSTSSDGTTGTGVYGLGIAENNNRTIEVPTLLRGAINLAVEGVSLSESNVAANVLTIGQLSVFTLAPTVAVSINRIASNNLPDKLFIIHVTNGNVTWDHGTNLKMAGSIDFTPGANGAMMTFIVKPGGIVWEVARTNYN